MNIGEKIKLIREKKGLTQKQLSELTGINRGTIGNYERGARTPNIEILKKIAHTLDVDINLLIDLENKNAWKNNIDILAKHIGLNMNVFSDAPIELKERFLNDIADTPIYEMQIQAVLNLIKESNNEELQNLIYTMIKSIIKELNIRNDKINDLELKLRKISEIIIDNKGDESNGNKEK